LLRSLGANSVILPGGDETARAMEIYDLQGILFSGGGDVAADYYGGRRDLCWDGDSKRDAGELSLLRGGFEARIPILCVCRGLQLANVAFDGTLIEDIGTELGERYSVKHHQVRELDKPPSERTHEVQLEADSDLARVLGARTLQTNSIHHQAIRMLAEPLRAVGHTGDGIVEAVELAIPDRFFYGVQWHPESLPADEASIRLYRAFVEAAGAYPGISVEA
jgi:putative glutamine amidotransferase